MARKKIGYVELEWTCPNCGTVNPGLEQSCVNCGAPQPEAVQFEQAKRQELIADEALKAKAEAGADIHCPYCGTRNSAGAEVCKQCGGDLAEGLKRERGRVVGAFKSGPVTQVACPHCGAENPDTAKECSQCGGSMQVDEGEKAAPVPQPKAEKPAKKRNSLVIAAIIGALVVVCCLAALFIILSMRTEAVAGTVQEVQWERLVVIEGLVPVEHNDWINEIPAEAEIGYCEEQVRVIQDSPAPNSDEVCGTPYTVDTGSGVGEVVQDCVYHVYEENCTYTVIEWRAVEESVLTGGDFAPVWPDPVLNENERLGEERDETYSIVFDTGGEVYVYTTSNYDQFQDAQIGSEWKLNINTFGSVVSIER